MQPKLIRTDVAEYAPAKWDGENRSGIRPLGEMVLVLTDQVKDQTAGGVFLTESNRDRQEMAAETGVLAAVGDGAFLWTHDKARPWEGEKPKIGDRVYIQRYAGQMFPGADGQRYRMMEYTCIGGLAEQRKEAAPRAHNPYETGISLPFGSPELRALLGANTEATLSDKEPAHD